MKLIQLIKLILKLASTYGYQTDFWTAKRIMTIAKKILKIRLSQATMHTMLYDKKSESWYDEA
jgi:hypothetical protein